MAMVNLDENPVTEQLRRAFPLLNHACSDRLAYLDNAATTQKPQAVVDAVTRFYTAGNANIHRGLYALSQQATENFEMSRQKVAAFIGAASANEIIFTRGATEAINLVAHSLYGNLLQPDSVVLLTAMEHHANIVPWQILQQRFGLRLEVVTVTESGAIDQQDFARKLANKPALLSFVHVSNSLGTINPAQSMIAAARAAGVPVLLDASQSVAHFPVNVQELDCDWLVFSGHKLFAPTGIGVLYGKYQRLAQMPPYQGGGDMIESVSFKGTVYKDPPARFEAGTPPIASAIGLAAAIDFIEALPQQEIWAHEQALLSYAQSRLAEIDGLRIIGTAADKVPVVSFILRQAHPHDIASVLDACGVAIRAGHHCTQPLMQSFGITGTARASFAFYNRFSEVDQLAEGLQRVVKLFS